MKLINSTLTQGVCFKCAHMRREGEGKAYRRFCDKHKVPITWGDAGAKCGQYELNRKNWYTERIQRYEYEWMARKNPQMKMEAYL